MSIRPRRLFFSSPRFYEARDFPAFLRSVEALEDDVMPEASDDAIQIAGFHPAWAFGASGRRPPLKNGRPTRRCLWY